MLLSYYSLFVLVKALEGSSQKIRIIKDHMIKHTEQKIVGSLNIVV